MKKELNVIAFWNERHERLNNLKSGGDRGITNYENYEFYIHRISQILKFISKIFLGQRPLNILDAGCGKGIFTESLLNAGYKVDSIDPSKSAIVHAQETSAKGNFKVTTIDNFNANKLYDVIICIDVLFHILDDEIWKKTLLKFIEIIKNNGVIILTDSLGSERNYLGDYIIHRSLDEYLKFFRMYDFDIYDIVPYDFGINSNKFLVLKRKGMI